MENDTAHYRTLEDLRKRKDELRIDIDRDHQRIERLWTRLIARQENTSQGQRLASLVSNGALAIDAFLLLRKLKRRGIFDFFRKRR